MAFWALYFILAVGFMGFLAISAIASMLPWIILAVAVGICMIMVTGTGCLIWKRHAELRAYKRYVLDQPASPRIIEVSPVRKLIGK